MFLVTWNLTIPSCQTCFFWVYVIERKIRKHLGDCCGWGNAQTTMTGYQLYDQLSTIRGSTLKQAAQRAPTDATKTYKNWAPEDTTFATITTATNKENCDSHSRIDMDWQQVATRAKTAWHPILWLIWTTFYTWFLRVIMVADMQLGGHMNWVFPRPVQRTQEDYSYTICHKEWYHHC